MSSTCDHDHDHSGLHGAALARALQGAEARVAEAGERMTPPRRRVLSLLLETGEPVKAYDLIARFGEDGQAAKPPTVYRALEFLERQGMAHRIASISAYVACSGGAANGAALHAAAFLICDCCGATREIAGPDQGAIDAAAASAGYAIARTTIEAHGLCLACRKAT
ncbi:Fur family transcriptional regulator [Brevundimonas sp. SL130]|uniref:Fur family transcriptional regulator n=1 Tax=Brevundimonas sp. SL130 TaxID=2995143 RepID=UPI00226C648C|nr:Fur family transcriptional regulator [Brevundimonas sp. SL130]WAC60412.1 Fur family transcriptional regulator [Brevundimonas sp. SL130]